MECLGRSQCTPFIMIALRLFHIMSFFWLPGLVKRDFFHWRQTQPVPRESIGHYTGLGQGILLELNPNILVRDAITMDKVQVFKRKFSKGNNCSVIIFQILNASIEPFLIFKRIYKKGCSYYPNPLKILPRIPG